MSAATIEACCARIAARLASDIPGAVVRRFPGGDVRPESFGDPEVFPRDAYTHLIAVIDGDLLEAGEPWSRSITVGDPNGPSVPQVLHMRIRFWGYERGERTGGATGNGTSQRLIVDRGLVIAALEAEWNAAPWGNEGGAPWKSARPLSTPPPYAASGEIELQPITT